MMSDQWNDQKRADYVLYTWQIRAIQRIARATQRPSSEVMRELLEQALRAQASKTLSSPDAAAPPAPYPSAPLLTANQQGQGLPDALSG